jgi:hypothetical protein
MTDWPPRCHPVSVVSRSLLPWLVVTSVGCGGTTLAGTASDASADRTTGVDGSFPMDASTSLDAGADTSTGCGFSCDEAGDAGLTPCPATPPAPQSPCSGPQACEYGTSWWLGCNYVMRCLPTGQPGGDQWAVEFDGGQCPWLDSGAPCPATWSEAQSVDAGSLTCPFVTCVYPEGFCGCGIGCGGGGGRPPPANVTGIFACIPTQPGCPEPRPLSGSACADSGTYCSYGFGCGCGQVQQCVEGAWQASRQPPCP